ncbi:hypothetical protein [Pseudomonas fluorescens]|nr:hypothetical protein [Pseudomonas fluorescens]
MQQPKPITIHLNDQTAAPLGQFSLTSSTYRPTVLGNSAMWRESRSTLGGLFMRIRFFRITPSKIRDKAEHHRARALSQLKSKSSLKVRHDRYNAEMSRARFFETMLTGSVQ